MSYIVWEFGATERSGASTALVVRTQVRGLQCKHPKNLFGSFSFLRQRTLLKPERSFHCALHMGIHPDPRRLSHFFVYILYYRSTERGKIPYVILRQLLRSGTSRGTHVEEAMSGWTYREFKATRGSM